MVLSDEKKREYVKRLMMSRMRLLINNGFYGLLLMHMIYSIDENCETVAADGRRIYFSPQFLDKLRDPELDFVLMHEILHIVLQHCFRRGDRDRDRFDRACDIVVNSNILHSNNMNTEAITIKEYGESIHVAPDGKEGYEYTAEQVYDMLPPESEDGSSEAQWDDHSRWDQAGQDDEIREEWARRFEDACEAVIAGGTSGQRGILPLFAERFFKELRRPQTDWRTILNDFIQTETVDYSFVPPDRRFDESPLFLPDFNDREDRVEDILFMIDTSGSMTDDMITAAYSEIKGALEQFDGKLKGWLGFFDAAIIEPEPFDSEDNLAIIKPAGGGGTDYRVIFDYVSKNMQDGLPACIIIMTDGYAPFPQENTTMGIPVLWLLNNEIIEPPWGQVARITVNYAKD